MAMRNIRTLLVSASLAIALLATTGCERHSKNESYYLIANNLKLPYWQSATAGFNKAAALYGVTAHLRGPDDYNVQAELEEFQKAVATRPAGILVSVADATVMSPAINAAIDAHIPVITMDSDAPNSHRLFFIGTNNLEAGKLGGQRAFRKLGGKGNVIFFSMPGQPNLDDRLKGYIDIFEDHPQIKIVDVINIKGESATAFDKTQQLLSKTGPDKIDAFICLEASAGKDVAEVLKRNHATDRLLIAMDVDPDTLQLIKEGVIDSTIAQKPYTMGYFGLKQLDEIHHYLPAQFRTDYGVDSFSPYPVFVDTGTALVDKNNVDIFLSAAAEAQGK
jgi:ribose transport system substrate-binding protein